MVNAKNVTFKVDKQIPTQGPPPMAVGSVINCRTSTVKRKAKAGNGAASHQVVLKVVGPDRKRKRDSDSQSAGLESHNPKSARISPENSPTSHTPAGSPPAMGSSTPRSASKLQRRPSPKTSRPTGKRAKRFFGDVNGNCLAAVMDFVHPAELLEMRKTPACYRILQSWPNIWVNSRQTHYGNEIPDPPTGLDEFQFADLRHGSGCQRCGAPGTRKTYWAFLRRWCQTCFKKETVKHLDIEAKYNPRALDLPPVKETHLPTAIIDSWGNYMGVGPAQTHSLKTLYRRRDVESHLEEAKSQMKEITSAGLSVSERVAKWKTIYEEKEKSVKERQEFAIRMEQFEERERAAKAEEHHRNKEARKAFFAEKASTEIYPPIQISELETYECYRRAILIPKEPHPSSWNHLKPKLEEERAARVSAQQRNMLRSTAIPIDRLLSHH